MTTATAQSPVPRTVQQPPVRLRLAYLTNKYPAVSHTFIRRELLELERRGHSILRLAIRPADSPPIDRLDVAEHSKTFHCLSRHKAGLVAAAVATAATRPVGFLRALATTLVLARRSDRGLFKHLAYLVEACVLLRLVRRERVQHVHVHFGTNAAAVALLMRRMGGPPYSVTIHGPDEFDAPIGLSLADKVAGAAFVVAITDYCAAQIKRWIPFNQWTKVHVVGCTVGDSFFDAARPVNPASATLVCVGRLNAQKGHMHLLEAFRDVVDSGVDARLVLAGDGELRGELEAQIARLGLSGRVEITGWIDEAGIRERILGSRALVLASFAEGLPMVLMEALAVGRPVIAPAIAGIPELVKPGVTGWLVPAGNVTELARAMQEALDAPVARLEALAAAGRDLVHARHHTATETTRLETRILSSLDSN